METIKGIYNKMNKGVFFGCLAVSLFLIITAFFVPPTAYIDGTVLAAVGEIFMWPVLWVVMLAIEKGSDIKLTKGDTTVHIDNPDKDNNRKTNKDTDDDNEQMA